MPCEYTYLKAHGSPAELIDRALGLVEGWMDAHIIKEAEAAGESSVYSLLARLSLKEKIKIVIPEGVDNLDDEYGGKLMWGEVIDMIKLRPAMDAVDAPETLRAFLESKGWYDTKNLDIPNAPEPLLSELVLHISLDGLLIYLDGWLSV